MASEFREEENLAARPVLLASEADKAKIEQLIYCSAESQLKALKDSESDSDAVMTNLPHIAVEIARIFSHCTHVAERPLLEEALTQSRGAIPEDADIYNMQAQVEELQKRVMELRADAPDLLAANVEQVLESNRAMLGIGSPEQLLKPREALQPIPCPTHLHLALQDSVNKVPVLRARLSETLSRLKRVVSALDTGKENFKTVASRVPSGAEGLEKQDTAEVAMADKLLFQKQLADSVKL